MAEAVTKPMDRRRTIFFDVDGVLVHGYHAQESKQRRWDEHLEQDLGVSPIAFRDQFIRGVFVSDVLTGRTSLIAALDDVLPSIGFNGSSMEFASYWLHRDSHLNHRLLEVVRRLRGAGTVHLVIATNQEHLRAAHLWNALGLRAYFDDIVYSARLGALKPDMRFFERAGARIGPQEQPPLLFDDSKAVVEGAAAFGWEAILFDEVEDCAGHPWVRRLLDS